LIGSDSSQAASVEKSDGDGNAGPPAGGKPPRAARIKLSTFNQGGAVAPRQFRSNAPSLAPSLPAPQECKHSIVHAHKGTSPEPIFQELTVLGFPNSSQGVAHRSYGLKHCF